jgi:uncharacterized membrane protein
MNRFKTWVLFPVIFLRNFVTAAWDIISTVKNAILKSFLWFVLTLFFGLLQSWIVLGKSQVLSGMDITSEFEALIMSGALLFFSTAIIASLTIDYFLLRGKIKHSKLMNSKLMMGFWFFLFPVIVFILCVSLFTMIHGKSAKTVDFELLTVLEFGILIATCIYAVIVKAVYYLNTEDEQQDKEHQ